MGEGMAQQLTSEQMVQPTLSAVLYIELFPVD
jgi:hypothetical protein